MNKFLTSMMVAMAAGIAFAADPVAPFHDYGGAEAHYDGYQMAVEWNNAKKTEIASATREEVLVGFTKDAAAATGLLAKIRGAYETDPMAAVQISAVTQWVMTEDPCFLFFWADFPSDGRKVWAKALMAKLKSASDDYVKAFVLDQLRWCGYPCQAKCVRAFAETEKNAMIRATADLVARGLESQE